MEFAIGIDVPVFKAYYPLVSQTSTTVGTPPKVKYTVTMSDPGGSLGSELDGWVTELKNLDPSYTTCCIQMSHAINMSFHTTDPNKMVGVKSYRRPTRKFKIQAAANKEFHYIASVDEMRSSSTRRSRAERRSRVSAMARWHLGRRRGLPFSADRESCAS